MNLFVKEKAEGLMRFWALLLVIAVALFATCTAMLHANQPLLEAHPFRQTQTALTSLWMIKESWRLDYQTPVGGFPWSIPFEFPLFQFLAAVIAQLIGWNLDAVGRLLSFSFLMSCAWPAFQIARRLELRRETALIFCALLWSSPLYLFWGRTFMIETAALFFILAAVPYALDLNLPDPDWKPAVFFLLFASLAMVQKVTTAAPVILILGFVALRGQIAVFDFRKPFVYRSLLLLGAFAIPLILAASWTLYCDLTKEENPFGAMLTSKALFGWNFGTIDQRLSMVAIKTLLWDRLLTRNAAGLLGVFIVSRALVAGDTRARKLIGTCLGLFLLPLLIFTNLHMVHDYYPLSSVVFFLAALAIALDYPGNPTVTWTRLRLVGIAVLSLLPLVDFEASRYLVFDPVLQRNPYGFVGFCIALIVGALLTTNRIRNLFLVTIATLMVAMLIGPSTYRFIGNEKYLLLCTQLGIIGLALTLATRALLGNSLRWRAILTSMLIVTNLFFFGRDYSAKLWLPGEVTLPNTWNIAEVIRANTSENAGVVTFGLDWSSVVAYYSQRKTFAVPDWFTGYNDVWLNPEKYLGGLKVGALVFCPSEKPFGIEQISVQPDVLRQPELLQLGPCLLWLAKR